MANHTRSNSLPSKSHPLMQNVEDHLRRLNSSDCSSVCSTLNILKDLHLSVSDLIQLPGIQQALSQGKSCAPELLDGSVRLLDSCGIVRDVVVLVKESVQELGSSLRRSRGEAVITHDLDAYMSSRKKVTKIVKKCIKNLKGFKQFSQVDTDQDLKTIIYTLREAEAIGFSVLKSVLMLISGVKGSNSRNNLLLSKFTQSRQVNVGMEQKSELNALDMHKQLKGVDAAYATDFLRQLKESEVVIEEIEGELAAFFRNLIKTRVSLLNVLSH